MGNVFKHKEPSAVLQIKISKHSTYENVQPIEIWDNLNAQLGSDTLSSMKCVNEKNVYNKNEKVCVQHSSPPREC